MNPSNCKGNPIKEQHTIFWYNETLLKLGAFAGAFTVAMLNHAGVFPYIAGSCLGGFSGCYLGNLIDKKIIDDILADKAPKYISITKQPVASYKIEGVPNSVS